MPEKDLRGKRSHIRCKAIIEVLGEEKGYLVKKDSLEQGKKEFVTKKEEKAEEENESSQS